VALTTTVNATLRSQLLPYLYPNQYVNYSAESTTVAKGAELAATATSQLGVVTNVYNYVVQNIRYDVNKATTVQSGYVPVVDKILSSGAGICFDYAAVMATMLRTQNIPTKMQVGYVAGNVYHAWISVYTPETGWINNVIYFDGANWKLMDPTLAANGTDAAYIGDGSHYSLMYQY
jgi:transglutaminase-like putative cysteine protease